jgi:hypothetical protein
MTMQQTTTFSLKELVKPKKPMQEEQMNTRRE